jgi:hypothetical protein
MSVKGKGIELPWIMVVVLFKCEQQSIESLRKLGFDSPRKHVEHVYVFFIYYCSASLRSGVVREYNIQLGGVCSS